MGTLVSEYLDMMKCLLCVESQYIKWSVQLIKFMLIELIACGTSGLLYGMIACLIALPCIMSCTYRTKMRNMYGLYESPAPDWIVHCLCEWCALCQEYRELQARGLDPTIGKNRNLTCQLLYEVARIFLIYRIKMTCNLGRRVKLCLIIIN